MFCLFQSSDGVQHVWHEPGQDHNSEFKVLTVKHGGGSVVIWRCIGAEGVSEMKATGVFPDACDDI